jgi:pyruvate formate lyase activating enzyme
MLLPLIVDIKRHSLEDGPGIRSVVFFKGCPLRCVFCQNPETWDPRQEIAFFSSDCIQCGDCVKACPIGAVNPSLPGAINRKACNNCGRCVDACPGTGLRGIGRAYDPDELLEILLRDASYYGNSGGVTFSGGECTMHSKFLRLMFSRLKDRNIHIALQTSGFFDYARMAGKIFQHVDLIHYDIKFADSKKHREYIGRSNRKIINNLLRLLKARPDIIHPRVPLIPGITATRKNLYEIAQLLVHSGAERVSLLPYNPMGIPKYESLGLRMPDLPGSFMNRDEEAGIYRLFGDLIRELKRKSNIRHSVSAIN